MPVYHFEVHNSHVHDDPEGTELSDDGAAHKEALRIIRDLKRNNAFIWSGWTIEVRDGARHVWKIAFIGAE